MERVVALVILLGLILAGLWRRLHSAPRRQAGHETLPAGEAFVNVSVAAVPPGRGRLDYAPEERVEGELVGDTVLRFRRREGVGGEIGIDWELIEL